MLWSITTMETTGMVLRSLLVVLAAALGAVPCGLQDGLLHDVLVHVLHSRVSVNPHHCCLIIIIIIMMILN
jgi:hypothetical protein